MAELDEKIAIPFPRNSPEPPTAAPPKPRRKAPKLPQDETIPSAIARTKPGRVEQALARARLCALIADENRAREILLLDLRQATPLLDFLVIATASSRRQVSAIAYEIDAEMKRQGERKLGMEGSEEGRWTLIDYGDFVVHLFSDEARAYYALEELWGDAPALDWRDDRPAGSPGDAPTP